MHDIVGRWQFGPNVAEFLPNCAFVLHVAAGDDQRGRYQIAEAIQISGVNALTKKRLSEDSGYFLLLTYEGGPGRVSFKELMRVEEWEPDRMVLVVKPFKPEDGDYRTERHEVRRCDLQQGTPPCP